MTELVYARQALLDLERLSDSLLQTDPQAAPDTAVLIFDALEILTQHPEIGRKVHFAQRELVIHGAEPATWHSTDFCPISTAYWCWRCDISGNLDTKACRAALKVGQPDKSALGKYECKT